MVGAFSKSIWWFLDQAWLATLEPLAHIFTFLVCSFFLVLNDESNQKIVILNFGKDKLYFSILFKLKFGIQRHYGTLFPQQIISTRPITLLAG